MSTQTGQSNDLPAGDPLDGTLASGQPGENPRNDPPADTQPRAPKLEEGDPDATHRAQDTQAVDGDMVTHLPPEMDLIQKGGVQG